MARVPFARRAALQNDSSLKEVLESFPGVISFAGGLPDEKAFPVDEIAEIVAEVSRDAAAWQYLPTEGHPALREAIAAHMAALGVQAVADNVLITQGSQQGLDLVAKLLIDPGDTVLMEAPGYLGAIGAALNYEARLYDIPVRDDGVDLDRLREAPGAAKYLYTVSTFQNPTGCSIPLARRPEILEIAASKGFYVVEDGAYRELSFEGRPEPPLKSFDTDGRVIYLGSFSKALVPGIRIGWIVADKEIIRILALLKQSTDLAANTLGQLFVLRWLERHGLTPPAELYRQKRDKALQALEKEMPPGVTWNRPKGGFFLWVRLPAGLDAAAMLPHARAAGVTYVPGAAFRGERSALRFSYSQVALEEIEPGVRRLARVVRERLKALGGGERAAQASTEPAAEA